MLIPLAPLVRALLRTEHSISRHLHIAALLLVALAVLTHGLRLSIDSSPSNAAEKPTTEDVERAAGAVLEPGEIFHGMHGALNVAALALLGLSAIAFTINFVGKRYVDPMPHDLRELPTYAAAIAACRDEGMFVDPDGPQDAEFLERWTRIGNEAFCFLSRKSREQRKDFYRRWMSNPRGMSLIFPPRSLLRQHEPCEPIGFVCVLPIADDVAARLRNGQMSQFDVEVLRPGLATSNVYVQAVYIRPRARRLLNSIEELSPIGYLATVRAIARVSLPHSPAPRLLAAGLSRRGKAVLRHLGFESASRSDSGDPMFELDLAHPPGLLNAKGKSTIATFRSLLDECSQQRLHEPRDALATAASS